MSEYAVSITVMVAAKNIKAAYKFADEIVEQIEEQVSHAYDVNHWNIEEMCDD